MKKTSLYSSFILLFGLSGFLGIYAQNVTINATIDSTVIWVGEQTALTFEVTQPNDVRIQFPIFSDNIPGGLEIAEPLKVDSVESQENLIVKHKYIVTAFEDSLLYIPSFPFIVNEQDTIWSKSLSLKIVQPFKIDLENQTITDIKPVLTPPFNWIGLLKIVLLVLFIIALIIGVFILIRKYIQKKPIIETVDVEPERPAHIIAFEKLEKIRNEKLWQRGRLKEYYTELTDVLRVYIGRVFEMNSMEMTSEEILGCLAFLRRDQKDIYNKLASILETADLVKFAKWVPSSDESELCLKNAFLFVENTKIEEEIESNEVEEATTSEENTEKN